MTKQTEAIEISKLNVYARLRNAQVSLKAPKGNYNSFGKYHYRSAEDILEAVKPINQIWGLTLVLKDSVEMVGNRFYIYATATVFDDKGDKISVTAMAREPESKKGMDDSQITGTASSYARKYALNGLYCIDDTKDADTEEQANEISGRTARENGKHQSKATKKAMSQPPTESDFKTLVNNLYNDILMLDSSLNKELVNSMVMSKLGVEDLKAVPQSQLIGGIRSVLLDVQNFKLIK